MAQWKRQADSDHGARCASAPRRAPGHRSPRSRTERSPDGGLRLVGVGFGQRETRLLLDGTFMRCVTFVAGRALVELADGLLSAVEDPRVARANPRPAGGSAAVLAASPLDPEPADALVPQPQTSRHHS